MGPEVKEQADDEGGGTGATACSICLDVVADAAGGRSVVKLHCGHEFHLDCIGSAFNAKGAMECPNCRKVEKGNWLYTNGTRTQPELSMNSWPGLGIDELPPDEDLYAFSYSELGFGIHWCPFSRLARLPTSFDEGEPSPITSFHDLFRHQAIFMEHPSASSTANACPFVTYLQPLQPSSSSDPPVASDGSLDGLAYHQHWIPPVPVATNVQTRLPVPLNDLHYHGWEHHAPQSLPSSHVSSVDQASASSATARISTDGQPRAGPFFHTYAFPHGSGSRSGASFVPRYPQYVGSPGTQPHVHEHHQHHHNVAVAHGTIPGVQRGARGLAPIGPTRHSSSENPSFYLFPSSGSSAQEVDRPRGYAWERNRATSGWLGHQPQSAASADSSRIGVWYQHASERQTSQGQQEGNFYQQNQFNRHHFT